MAYAALQDMVDRYGTAEMTDITDRGDTGAPDPDVAGVALADATATIDAYLSGRYLLPLDPVPAVAVQWCCQIARFLLWKNDANDAVTLAYKAAMAGLGRAQDGSMNLEAAGIDTGLTTDTVELLGRPREFGVRDASGYPGGRWGGF